VDGLEVHWVKLFILDEPSPPSLLVLLSGALTLKELRPAAENGGAGKGEGPFSRQSPGPLRTPSFFIFEFCYCLASVIDSSVLLFQVKGI